MTESALARPAPRSAGAPAPRLQPRAAAPSPAVSAGKPRPLDLSRVAPPGNLDSLRVEELTIDGICGVY